MKDSEREGMASMKRIVSIIVVLAMVCSFALAGSGCSNSKNTKPTLKEPLVEPPAVKEAGKLYVGVDYEYMPYSGMSEDKLKGIDIDVASLIADDLGLAVEFVEVPHKEGVDAIDEGTVDIAMSMVLGDVDPTAVTVSGIYAKDASAIFAKADDVDSIKKNGLKGKTAGGLISSYASWEAGKVGVSDFTDYNSLPEAFDALSAGEVDAVACDAIVGGYLATRYEDIKFAEQIGSAELVGVGVKADNTELQKAVQNVLDTAKRDGRLEVLLLKWVGQLPDLKVESSTESSATPAATDGATEPTNGELP